MRIVMNLRERQNTHHPKFALAILIVDFVGVVRGFRVPTKVGSLKSTSESPIRIATYQCLKLNLTSTLESHNPNHTALNRRFSVTKFLGNIHKEGTPANENI